MDDDRSFDDERIITAQATTIIAMTTTKSLQRANNDGNKFNNDD
jgi:hypothetical protein